MSEWLSVNEAVKVSGLSMSTIRRLIKQSVDHDAEYPLKCQKLSHGKRCQWLVDVQSLKAYAAETDHGQTMVNDHSQTMVSDQNLNRMVDHLQDLKDQIKIKDEQLKTKDDQIQALQRQIDHLHILLKQSQDHQQRQIEAPRATGLIDGILKFMRR